MDQGDGVSWLENPEILQMLIRTKGKIKNDTRT